MKKLFCIFTVCAVLICCLFGCGRVEKDESMKCTVVIDCITVLDNMDSLKEEKKDVIPVDGIILPETEMSFSEGETAYDMLKKVCREKGIHLEASVSPAFNAAYIEGINNLYEFDCGEMSGWIYTVNGKSLSCGCDSYIICEGDTIRFYYACQLSDYYTEDS